MDFRLVLLGAVLPDLVDGPFGGPRVAHTVLGAVGLLLVTMVATLGRRPLRRRVLAVPIGVLVHLVLDGMWTDAAVFWWPARGWSFPHGPLPSLSHPILILAVEELAGLAMLIGCYRRFGLGDPGARAAFLRSGRCGL